MKLRREHFLKRLSYLYSVLNLSNPFKLSILLFLPNLIVLRCLWQLLSENFDKQLTFVASNLEYRFRDLDVQFSINQSVLEAVQISIQIFKGLKWFYHDELFLHQQDWIKISTIWQLS